MKDEKEIINSSMKKPNMKLDNKNKISISTILSIILSFILILLAGYNLYFNIFKKIDDINYIYLIINNSILLFITIIICLFLILKGKIKKIFKYVTLFSMIFFILFNVMIDNNIIKIESQKLVPNLVGMTYNDANVWSLKNNIILDTIYEYSDIYDEYTIINQNIESNQLLKKINKITLVISKGPNYDKTIVLTNMAGWNIDDAIKEMNNNYLNNVEINYVKNNNIAKDIIIEQNIKGQMRRNDKIIFTVSLGNDEFETLAMIDLNNKSLFDAELWLKRNNIKFKIEYDFSDNIKRNNVISSSILKDKNITSTDTVNLIVSKGNPIIVPDILNMTVDEVTKWIIDNNLKISYQDKYDDNIKLGNIISSNYKKGDTIEEETEIKLVSSRGPLKMESFTSLNEFRTWANKYNVKYNEEYLYNNSIARGNIIKFSINKDDIIINDQSIVVYISNGKAITIPDFIGKTKTEATTICKSKGLNCNFIYNGYSSSAKDTIINQNKKTGITVVNGTYVTLTLTKGPASSCKIYIQSEWFASSADGTISSLKTKLNAALLKNGCSDVKFNFIKKPSNNEGNSGMIHPNSAILGGYNTFTEGKTYTITIISN